MPRMFPAHPCQMCKCLTRRLAFCSRRCYWERRLKTNMERDAEILRLQGSGLYDRQIGELLGITENTAKHVAHRKGFPKRVKGPKVDKYCRDCGVAIDRGPRILSRCPKHRQIYLAQLKRNSARKRLNIPPERWRLNF